MRNLGRNGAVIGHFDRLFRSGTALGRSDADLLKKFAEHRDEAAFEALLLRFGPMVLGVCRQMLRDPRDVEDAFQATFLILARKAGAIRQGELLGNWLYGVAHRVAVRARSQAWQRSRRETSEPPEVGFVSPDAAEQAESRAILHEELGRLPEKYRAPVVLCHLQGFSHEEAARRLQWPVGTVRGRLARARDLLRDRLTRRGLAGSAMIAIASLDTAKAAPVVSLTLVQATARLAITSLGFRALATGAIPAAVATLTRGASTAMLFTPWKIGITTIVSAGIIGSGFAGAVAWQEGEGPGPKPPEATVVEEPITTELSFLPGQTVTIHPRENAESDIHPSLRFELELQKAQLRAKQSELQAQAARVELAEGNVDETQRMTTGDRMAVRRTRIAELKIAQAELERINAEVQEARIQVERAEQLLNSGGENALKPTSVNAILHEALRAELHERQIEIQQAELDATRQAFDKALELHHQGVISDSERIEAEIRVQKAEAALAARQLEALQGPTDQPGESTDPGRTSRPGSGGGQGVTLDLSGTLDRRLQEIERKLDLILEQLQPESEISPEP